MALLYATQAPHIRLFVLLALHTAAHTGALLSLSWEQVDLNSGLIYLGRTRGKKRRATVPITDVLRDALEEAAQAATSEWVIEYAGHPVRSIKSGFRAAVRRAGLEGVTPHILRHTAATWMVQSDVPLALVAAYLGNSVEMVARVYGHHSPSYAESGRGVI